ncbi:NADP-dependent oxidoreductase [Rhizobium halophytocola]|uniref:NADPH:quinone reductase-like Zn-dependent oxidoreductase n=1 Tax=Rhizobium halophytocola TaxID=735519 RepID=A0ABS4DSF8_9HYPH|nr:NADP-dependent oxidoreductase [Rhizobium halophytocola]MBP1848626.1 NADPH:quinone reductase-like Zn-dependent oxidoreductase [Rhizobium halophytocola]
MSEMMKAVRLHAFGGPEVLRYEDALKPVPAAGEVLVRVHAVGLNPPDWYLRDGYSMLPPEWQPKVAFPIIPGTDISGVVETLGPDVAGFAAGDAVYAMVRFPEGMAGESRAYAQYVTVPAEQLSLKPAGIDHRQAAAAPMSLLTAWQFLVDLGHDAPNPLQPDQHRPVPLEGRSVLVNGAAGGVGHFALQVAKRKGAHVTAVASGRHAALLRDLGADAVIDYTRTPPEDVAGDLDLVVDALGGPSSARFLRTLKRGGALFPVFPLGFAGAEEAEARGVTVSATQVRSSGAQLAEVGRLMADGSIRVVLDSNYPLSDARLAHARAAKGHIQGKIVLDVA